MNDWESFEGETARVCLECGHRWAITKIAEVTDSPGCPECGFSTADVLTETTSSAFDLDERLVSAKVEIEIYGLRKDGGFRMGWLKDHVDSLLKILIDADLDTSSKMSGAPASEYIRLNLDSLGIRTPDDQADATVPEAEADGVGPDGVQGTILDFLNQLNGRRARLARDYQWDDFPGGDDRRN